MLQGARENGLTPIIFPQVWCLFDCQPPLQQAGGGEHPPLQNMWTSAAFLTHPHSSSHTLPLLVLPLEGWHPCSTASCYPLPLARDVERNLRGNRGPLVVAAASRTTADVGEAGRCLQPELQNKMVSGDGFGTSPFPRHRLQEGQLLGRRMPEVVLGTWCGRKP